MNTIREIEALFLNAKSPGTNAEVRGAVDAFYNAFLRLNQEVTPEERSKIKKYIQSKGYSLNGRALEAQTPLDDYRDPALERTDDYSKPKRSSLLRNLL